MTTTRRDDDRDDPTRSSTPGVSGLDDIQPMPECSVPGIPLASGFEAVHGGRRRRIELSPEAKARVQRAWDEFDRSQRIVARDGRNHVIG